MTSAVAVSAPFDINNTVNTTQTLNAGEAGIVRSPNGAITGVGLGVNILGSNATLTNQGTVSATSSGVRVSGPITGVTITNSGYISGFIGIKVGSSADVSGGIANSGHIFGYQYGIFIDPANVSGGITNQAGATISGGRRTGILISSSVVTGGIGNGGLISGGSAGIGVVRGSDLRGSINNSGTIFGSVVGLGIASSDISGGVNNSGMIVGSTFAGIIVQDFGRRFMEDGAAGAASDISGGILNRAGGLISGGATGIVVMGGADISGGILNRAGGTISGGFFGIKIGTASDISGGIDNSGTILGGAIGIFVDPADISGGVVNRAGGIITGASTGIKVRDFGSDISGGVDNSGTIFGGTFGITVEPSLLVALEPNDLVAASGGVLVVLPPSRLRRSGRYLRRRDQPCRRGHLRPSYRYLASGLGHLRRPRQQR